MIYLSHKKFTADELAVLYRDAGEFLGDIELAEFAHFRVPKRKSEFLTSRAAIKDLVFSCSPQVGHLQRSRMEIFKMPSGVPYLSADGQRLPGWISLSHSNGHVFAAYSPDDIRFGVDIEHIETRADEFIAEYFTKRERDFLHNLPATERSSYATLAWSLKESILKTAGTGLGIDTRSLEISFPLDMDMDDGWKLASLAGSRLNMPGFRLSWRRSGDFVLTVCTPENEAFILF